MGISACAKKEEAVPAPAAESCSYVLDGRSTTGSSQVYLNSRQLPDGTLEDWLLIQLTSYPGGPTAQAELVSVQFHKPKGSTDTAYQPLLLRLTDGNGKVMEYPNNRVLTLVKTSTGYSGTFAGTLPAPASSSLAQGVFTDAKL